MITKNISQNGEKSVDGILASLVPSASKGKDQMNVEVQSSNSPGVLLNKDYELPEKIMTPKGIATRTVSMSGVEKYGKVQEQAARIDYGSKKSQSFIGVDIDFGIPIEDLVNLIIELLQREYIEDGDEGAMAILSVIDPIKRWVNGGNVTAQEMEQINMAKWASLESLITASKVFYSEDQNAYNTLLMDRLQDAIKGLDPLSSLFFMSGEEALSYMQDKVAGASMSLYNYTKPISPYEGSRNSQSAKEKLLNNPWYISHVMAISQGNPELLEQLEMAATAPYITDLEAKVVNEIMRHHDQLADQKKMLQEEFGYDTMNSIFSQIQSTGGTLQELLDMNFYLYDTAIDDEIRKGLEQVNKITVNFDNYFDSLVDFDPQKEYNINNAVKKFGELTSKDLDIPTKYNNIFQQMVPVNYDTDPDIAKFIEKRRDPTYTPTSKSKDQWESQKEKRMMDIELERLKDAYAKFTTTD